MNECKRHYFRFLFCIYQGQRRLCDYKSRADNSCVGKTRVSGSEMIVFGASSLLQETWTTSLVSIQRSVQNAFMLSKFSWRRLGRKMLESIMILSRSYSRSRLKHSQCSIIAQNDSDVFALFIRYKQ